MNEAAASPWLTVAEAAGRARVGRKTIYASAKSGKLRAARINGRRDLRLLASWIDTWLEASAVPVEMHR